MALWWMINELNSTKIKSFHFYIGRKNMQKNFPNQSLISSSSSPIPNPIANTYAFEGFSVHLLADLINYPEDVPIAPWSISDGPSWYSSTSLNMVTGEYTLPFSGHYRTSFYSTFPTQINFSLNGVAIQTCEDTTQEPLSTLDFYGEQGDILTIKRDLGAAGPLDIYKY
jgi:hypothetical protein